MSGWIQAAMQQNTISQQKKRLSQDEEKVFSEKKLFYFMNIFKMKTGGLVEVATFHLPQKIASEIVSDERE